ncbi:mannitol-1-phosphate dehydrogenase [Rhodotorula toruloides]|uniref:Mannitol-1-phosphate dehydrogenase n=1 Tax=Rhodotorula toruloides TaxID=5286 RepID=A0A511KMM8_RHOTO|nr:mannitol-1-phosphate dehydrogenase [Rhodotorula toruloides]
MASTSQRKPLTTSQESRLVRYLDGELLRFSGAYESRHSGTSRLPDLSTFLDALVPLQTFILSIPSVPPSSSLRVAYYLNLTSFIAPALNGYTILDETLDKLFGTLERFDRGWVAVLRGQEWDPAAAMAKEGSSEGDIAASGMRNTDRIRLESLVRDTNANLAIALGLPEFVALETDPFQELARQQNGRIGPARPEAGLSGLGSSDAQMQSASQASTPSLVSDSNIATDTDETMSVETEVAGDTLPTPTDGADMDDDEDEVDFEEVAVISPVSSHSIQRYPLPDAYADEPSADGSFQIHFTGLPPPTMQDGELSLQQGETPIIGQHRGFDPDSEYPLSEEDGDPIGGNAVTGGNEEDATETEDGMEESTRERVKRVFERTEWVLAESRASQAA